MQLNKIEKIIVQLDKIEQAFFKQKNKMIDTSKQADINLMRAISKLIDAKDLLIMSADYLRETEEANELDKVKADLEKLLG
jgi:hypothetical protein